MTLHELADRNFGSRGRMHFGREGLRAIRPRGHQDKGAFGDGISLVAAPLIFEATSVQSMPSALASLASPSSPRPSLCTCRLTRSCTVPR